MSASLLLPVALVMLFLACCVEIVRDVTFRRYGQALAGLVLGAIFIAATLMSAGPLLILLGSAV